MAAKPESAAPPAPAAPAPAEKKKGIAAFLPLVLSCVLAPAATWAVAEFVLLPRLKAQLVVPAASSDGTVAAAPATAPAPAGKGAPDGAASYEFSNVVVNLAGTMGTRYLKTSFLVTGADPAIKSVFESQKPRLTDVTLNVLSSLTLADLEEPGARNIIREKLVLSYNQALGRKVAEQVYFSDFVVQ